MKKMFLLVSLMSGMVCADVDDITGESWDSYQNFPPKSHKMVREVSYKSLSDSTRIVMSQESQAESLRSIASDYGINSVILRGLLLVGLFATVITVSGK
jgi:coenzyme F420-reducing hydrogenase beta subunit